MGLALSNYVYMCSCVQGSTQVVFHVRNGHPQRNSRASHVTWVVSCDHSPLPCLITSNTYAMQMCVRINNIHLLIKVFELLEDHLYSCLRTALPKPITAFGYVSSDPGELSLRHTVDKPNPHHASTHEHSVLTEEQTSARRGEANHKQKSCTVYWPYPHS